MKLSISPLLAVSLALAPYAEGRSQPHAAPPSITIDSSSTAADGTVTLKITLTVPPQAPQPPPTPLSISSLTLDPQTVFQGQGATGTVTLERSPGQPVQIAIAALDTRSPLVVPAAVTIQPGQTRGTFAIGTAAAPNTDFWYTVAVSLNGQSKAASLLVRSNAPHPTPGPQSGPPRIRSLQQGRLTGENFGTLPGSLWIEGTPTLPLSWGDTLITWSADSVPLWAGIRRSDGAEYAAMVPSRD